MARSILYTRHDGGVTICTPHAGCLRAMSLGGAWSDQPRGYVDAQIERQIAAGHAPDAAARFARAMAFGGVTEREAIGIIKDRDCGHLGTAHELIDVSALPDRWFRDAWRRSHNGGPIYISLSIARQIQFSRIRTAVISENERRASLLDGEPISVDLCQFKSRIRASRDEDELRDIWPDSIRGRP